MTGTFFIGESGPSMNVHSNTFGDISMSGGLDGRFSGTITNVPGGSVESVTFQGIFLPLVVVGTYQVTFPGGGGTADGTFIMFRQPG